MHKDPIIAHLMKSRTGREDTLIGIRLSSTYILEFCFQDVGELIIIIDLQARLISQCKSYNICGFADVL